VGIAYPFKDTETHEFETTDAVIAVACHRCRIAAFYEDVPMAVRSLTEHAEQCGTRNVLMAEMLPPVDH